MYEGVSHDDLLIILNNSIIRYDGKPVYVVEVPKKGQLLLQYLCKDSTVFPVLVKDPLLNFVPITLGMCNTSTKAVYLSRVPARQYRQGLCQQNLKITSFTGARDYTVEAEVWDFRTGVLLSCIEGNYPTISDAIALLEEDQSVESVAFNRDFALNSDYELFFRTTKVGMYDPDTQKLLFTRTKKFLQEIV